MTGRYSGRLPTQFHTVTDERVADMLTSVRWTPYYEPFLARTSSVKDAAQQAGCSLNEMLYRVRRMHQAGLLIVVDTVKRAGRPVKLYRTAHDAYFIPFDVTPYANNEEHFRALYGANAEKFAHLIARRLSRNGLAGRRLYRTEYGEVWIEGARDTTTPSRFTENTPEAAFDIVYQAYLPPDVAQEVQATLSDLMLKLRPYTTPNGNPLYALTMLFMRDDP